MPIAHVESLTGLVQCLAIVCALLGKAGDGVHRERMNAHEHQQTRDQKPCATFARFAVDRNDIMPRGDVAQGRYFHEIWFTDEPADVLAR